MYTYRSPIDLFNLRHDRDHDAWLSVVRVVNRVSIKCLAIKDKSSYRYHVMCIMIPRMELETSRLRRRGWHVPEINE